ncbi:MAG: maleylpyruvate isomerase N-terminal domain-containing protein [Actinomycetota bacterium]
MTTEYLRSTDEVVAAYVALRARVIALVRERPESDGDRPVPHCPAWRVRDLVAHMVGGPEDILAGRLEGVATDAWTQAQVERHRGDTLAQLADAWEATIEPFDVVLPMIPAPVNSQLVLDAVTHEHDLRHALGVPDARDGGDVVVAIGWVLHTADATAPGMAERLLASGLDDFDLLRVSSGRRSREQIEALGVEVALIEILTEGTPVTPPETSVVE